MPGRTSTPPPPPPAETTTTPTESMFRPPINRSMRQLDRTFFTKLVPLCAARVSNNKHIARLRTELERSRDLLPYSRVRPIQPDPDETRATQGGKCLLLREGIGVDGLEDPSTWSEVLRRRVREEEVGIVPFTLVLDYAFWSYREEILSSILPEDRLDEIPSGFNLAGHVAHLNLREEYRTHKDLIATVLLDKNPAAKTVINKLDDVGSSSVYRTFNLEILAGEPNLNVQVKSEDCHFRFDYSKVYWNSKLNTEHHRLVDLFKEGEAVCDVMAGVGPFAIPAGKKHVFVWANDLNPDSYASLKDAVKRNKVESFVHPFNADGRAFIRHAVEDLQTTSPRDITIESPPRRSHHHSSSTPIHAPVRTAKTLVLPQTFHHFVMNLPASAITFLDAFIGLYHGQEGLFEPYTETKLPLIHVYCFSTTSTSSSSSSPPTTTTTPMTTAAVAEEGEAEVSDDAQAAAVAAISKAHKKQICLAVSQVMRYDFLPLMDEIQLWHVRDVAPRKRMYCVTFRLPSAIAFRERQQAEHGKGDELI
ncbi:MAG: tRNA(m(1)G37)methyltransferase [Peltula sp. TS41687]|nr:MAG: tRNA(m(1)G37)methyltransferase [Peltula sp. TS41687]